MAGSTYKVMRYCTPVAVLLGEDEALEAIGVWELVTATVVDDVGGLDAVVNITDVEVILAADDVPGTHWSIMGPHNQ